MKDNYSRVRVKLEEEQEGGNDEADNPDEGTS